MESTPDHRELPPIAAFLLRWLRRLAGGGGALLALLVLAELATFPFLSKRSDRFLRAGSAYGQPVWFDNVFFSYRFATARAARPAPPTVVPQTPAPGTLRVCLLGGASAMGFPDASFGIGRQLLRNRDRRSRSYFLQSLRTWPLQGRAWAGWMMSALIRKEP